MRFSFRFFSILFLFCFFSLNFIPPVFAEVSTNVPLSHWSYPIIEKLATLGLVREAMLNMKPYSRIEMAKMVVEAKKNYESIKDEKGTLQIVEGLLERMEKEYQEEISALSASEGMTSATYLRPIHEIYGKYIYGKDQFDLDNQQGDKFARHSNYRFGFSSYGQYANFVGYYLHPEYRFSESEINEVKLVEGYLKCNLGNLEIEVGRDSLWWGPGAQGDLILTDNARPFDLLKLSNAEPILLPWVFRRFGPMKSTFFVTQLEEDRDYPHTKFAGIRVEFKPTPSLELGFSRTAMFAGEGRPSYHLRDYWDLFWGRKENEPTNPHNNNQIAGADFRYQFANLDKRIHLLRTVTLYADGGAEDMAGVLPSRWAFLYGINFGDIGLNGKNDLRIEYANDHVTADYQYKDPGYWYTHPVYTSGYTYYGDIMGHEMGSDSNDLFIEWVHFFSSKWRGSLAYDQHKSRLSDAEPAKIRYLQPQLIFYGKENLTISAAYRYWKEEAGNKRGTDETNHIIILNTTYTF